MRNNESPLVVLEKEEGKQITLSQYSLRIGALEPDE